MLWSVFADGFMTTNIPTKPNSKPPDSVYGQTEAGENGRYGFGAGRNEYSPSSINLLTKFETFLL